MKTELAVINKLTSGKILTDDKVIKEYEISAFIVVMVSKPKTSSSEVFRCHYQTISVEMNKFC